MIYYRSYRNTIQKKENFRKKEVQAVSKWLKENEMTVNADRFKAIAK